MESGYPSEATALARFAADGHPAAIDALDQVLRRGSLSELEAAVKGLADRRISEQRIVDGMLEAIKRVASVARTPDWEAKSNMEFAQEVFQARRLREQIGRALAAQGMNVSDADLGLTFWSLLTPVGKAALVVLPAGVIILMVWLLARC